MSLIHYDYEFNRVDSELRRSRLQEDQNDEIEGNSLWLFSPENCFREKMAHVANHNLFEAFIIVCIVVSTITLAFEEPLDDPKSQKVQNLKTIDLVMTVVFTLEATLKVIALGFLINGKPSYLRSVWNMLDFTIVLAALTSLMIEADLGFIKALRILRILRPLRLVTRIEGLKIAVVSLFKALPSILQL